MAERVGGMLAVLLGGIAIAEAAKLYTYRSHLLVGDHAMPGLLGILMILLGLSLLATGQKVKSHIPFPKENTRNKLLLMIGSMILFYFLVPLVGQIAGVALVSALLFKVIGSYRWYLCVLFSMGFTFLLDLVFVEWLQVSFPRGIIFH